MIETPDVRKRNIEMAKIGIVNDEKLWLMRKQVLWMMKILEVQQCCKRDIPLDKIS